MLAEGEAPLGSLQAFLEKVSLVADADQIPEEEQEVVTLMTLHTAKGLEFPVVFLTGWEDGQFPHMRALGDPTELAEERRLAYVGITRAKKQLFISRAMTRSAWGSPVNNPASRFLGEVPDELWEWIREEPDWGTGWGSAGYADGTGFGGSGSFGGHGSMASPSWGGASRSGRSKPTNGRPTSGKPTRSNAKNGKKLELEVGDKVNHDKYGLGTVKQVDGAGPHTTAMIDFGGQGTVRLMLFGGVPMEKL